MKRKLNNLQVKNSTRKPDGKPLNLSDCGGRYIHIQESCKSWRYNYRFKGKQKTLTIDPIPCPQIIRWLESDIDKFIHSH